MHASIGQMAGGRQQPAVHIGGFGQKSARTYLDRAYTHLFDGDYAGAESDYRLAVRLNPIEKDVKEDLARMGRVLCTMR